MTIKNPFFTALADEFNVKSPNWFSLHLILDCAAVSKKVSRLWSLVSIANVLEKVGTLTKQTRKSLVNSRTKLVDFLSLNLLVKDQRCIPTSKTMIKAVKQRKK